jgi:NAD(P)-dependent dehydrogenase (short-subunit alcohol dehydrogenase family)
VNPLQDTVVVVTGASSGIGRAIAVSLGGAGAIVVAVGRSPERLEETCGTVIARGGRAVPLSCDVTSETAVAALFDRVETGTGPIGVLVNSAGIFGAAPIEDMPVDEWRRVLDVNLTGSFLCMREAIRHMKPRRTGRILNIGSISSFVPRPLSAAYAASKAGLVGLTRTAAIETREHGISVGCLHPGNVATDMRHDLTSTMNREPMMRVEEVAALATAMLTVGPGTTVWELTALPIEQQYLGRG